MREIHKPMRVLQKVECVKIIIGKDVLVITGKDVQCKIFVYFQA